MPTLLRIFGLRFFFYLDEHLPIHVYVECGGKLAKIEIEQDVKVVYNHGLKEQELKTAVDTCSIWRRLRICGLTEIVFICAHRKDEC